MCTIKLPETIEEFKAALNKGLEFYQFAGELNAKDALNESMAKALSFDCYADLAEKLPKKAKHTLLINHNDQVFINETFIDQDIFDNELVKYEPRTIDELIENIKDILPSCSNPFQTKKEKTLDEKNRDLMLEDIKLLESAKFENDDYIFSSIETNMYISENVNAELFDSVCEEILELNKNYK